MCHKNTPIPIPIPTQNSEATQTTSTIMKKKTQKQHQHMKKELKSSSSFSSSSSSSSSLKPHRRRNRTKTRKPKYLSLRLQLSQAKPEPESPTQKNLKSLYTDDRDIMHEENNVALLFTSDGGATLTGLLEDESTTTAATSEGSPSEMTCPPAMEGLVRKAMRKGRGIREVEGGSGGEEERWVCYSEVVEEIKKEPTTTTTEEVTSYCGGDHRTTTATAAAGLSFGSLSLKLDHEGILNAWSDKGPLYIGDEAPQTVPDLFNGGGFLHTAFPPNVASWDSWGVDVVGNTWKVPEDNKTKVKEEMDWKVGQREASVQRYKEKRQNRLFAKKIRYEVRKRNAEKRPRMKGRFVKRE